jgi:hypothetical protein
MSIEDLSDEELDAVFFEMAIDNNIDLLDESIIELEKKESLTEDERINLENKKQQLVNLVKIKKNGK